MQAAQATLRQRSPPNKLYHVFLDASRTGYAEAKIVTTKTHIRDCQMQAAQATLRQRPTSQRHRSPIWMQATQATVQGKSKRLPQGKKYLTALKNRTNGTNYENAKTPRRMGR